jgi:hypothetical protein
MWVAPTRADYTRRADAQHDLKLDFFAGLMLEKQHVSGACGSAALEIKIARSDFDALRDLKLEDRAPETRRGA